MLHQISYIFYRIYFQNFYFLEKECKKNVETSPKQYKIETKGLASRYILENRKEYKKKKRVELKIIFCKIRVEFLKKNRALIALYK